MDNTQTHLAADNNDSKPRGNGKYELSRKLDLLIEKFLITFDSNPFTHSESQIAVTRDAGSLQLRNSTVDRVSLFCSRSLQSPAT